MDGGGVVSLTNLFPKCASADKGRVPGSLAVRFSLLEHTPLEGNVLPIWIGQQPLFRVICRNDDDCCWITIVAHWQDDS